MNLNLNWHRYKYFPYEQQLALREVESLLGSSSVKNSTLGLKVSDVSCADLAARLVYFAGYSENDVPVPTQQGLLERVNGNGLNRQSTRYSAHGLHEYKGKFNPQIAKALLNIFAIRDGAWALDPFCGSGTSLVEASHLGINAVGTDINPLAVYLANAKLQSLTTPAETLATAVSRAVARSEKSGRMSLTADARLEYLQSWFPPDFLRDIEALRLALEEETSPCKEILLAIASNLLRDYSLQEPSDLRIRRRMSPLPDEPFFTAFNRAAEMFIGKLADSQSVLSLISTRSNAQQLDCRQSLDAVKTMVPEGFDVALTSPPYATALPYIDTQRLSLVWLGLLAPFDIRTLEARLVGSREILGANKMELLRLLEGNAAHLPEHEAQVCIEMQNTLTEQDGFRRQAVPRLLYRYFADMADSFVATKAVMKPGAKYGLIVGGNHTVLSGRRFDIDTPNHIAGLAVSRGWTHLETVELQTYKRYGLHAKNAGSTEALVILEA